MFSKLTSWLFGKPPNEDRKRAQEYNGTPSAPCPPPVPARKTKSELNVNSVQHALNQGISNGGNHIPKALKSAFERPEKDKKPFSYFAQGQPPDLSSKPSPRLIKQTNPVLNGPPIPKVLPFVTENDLKLEEQRPKSPMPGVVTAVTNSSQYNTPIALYSKRTIQEEFHRHSAEPGSENFDVNVNNIHEKPAIHLRTPTRNIESDVEDASRYTGFMNPQSQSPCFKRLQYITGLNTDSEDERSVEIRPTDVKRNDSTRITADISHKLERNSPDFVDKAELQHSAAKSQDMYRNGHPQSTMSSSYHESNSRYYEQRGPEQDYIEDAGLLAKISEAEKPKLPAQAMPDWVRQAEMKHDKWRGYAEYQESHRYEGPTVAAARMSPTSWRRAASQTPAFKESSSIRAKSIEPSSSRFATTYGTERSRAKEPWMKPYVAPNVLESSTLTKPLTIRTSVETPIQRPIHTPLATSGTTYRPATHDYASKLSPTGYKSGSPTKWSSVSNKSRETYSYGKSPVPQYKIETTYLTPLPSAAQETVGDQPPWTASRRETDKKWHFEQEACNKHKEMEYDMSRKAREPSTGRISPRWKPAPSSERSLATTEGPAITQKWQDDTGASTKSQTTGSYLDKDGNMVTYVKEVYTTSDPGKEFSMLTQEEKKVLEEPLQPGVISRHTTTKYYKKSTYTSSTTTSASPSQPAISSAPLRSSSSTNALTYPRKFAPETQF